MNMTKQIVHYISENALSIEEISNATGVEKWLLRNEEHRGFNATEMLEVCNYLQVDPYIFFEQQDSI